VGRSLGTAGNASKSSLSKMSREGEEDAEEEAQETGRAELVVVEAEGGERASGLYETERAWTLGDSGTSSGVSIVTVDTVDFVLFLFQIFSANELARDIVFFGLPHVELLCGEILPSTASEGGVTTGIESSLDISEDMLYRG